MGQLRGGTKWNMALGEPLVCVHVDDNKCVIDRVTCIEITMVNFFCILKCLLAEYKDDS